MGRVKSKDRSLRQLLQLERVFPVGAAAGCDLLLLKKAPAQPTADRGRSGLDGGFLLPGDHCAMVFTDTPRSIGVERP